MNGQFYSVIAILIVIPIFIFTIQYLNYSQSMDNAISDRVISDQLGQLAYSIEIDTKKAMEVSGRRALLEATNFVINSGEPLSDAVENLTTLMTLGSINGSESFLLQNNTMPNWSARITGKPVNFDVTLEYGNITIENNDGFSIRIGMDINMTLTDKLKRARIEKTNVRNYVTISLIGLEDPIFPLNTYGFVRRTIRRPPQPHANFNLVSVSTFAIGSCTGPVTFNKSEDDDTKILVADNITGVVYSRHLGIILGDTDNLSAQIDCYISGNSSAVSLIAGFTQESGYEKVYIDADSKSAWSMPIADEIGELYYYRDGGPDFLQRLEGNLSGNPDGIATFIYVPEMEAQAFSTESDSRVAYRYFNGEGECLQVRNMPDWYGMDSTDAEKFNFTDLLTSDPCESESS